MGIKPKLRDELLALLQRDTDTRKRLLDEGRLYGDYAQEMQQVHRENAERLAAVIERHGWPGPARVGLEASRAAWTIAQHSICTPALQRGFLDALKAAVARGDAPKLQLAYLTDRIRFNEGRPEVYGTAGLGSQRCIVVRTRRPGDSRCAQGRGRLAALGRRSAMPSQCGRR